MSISKLRVFVSHSSKDNDFGIKLVQDLRRILGDHDAVWYDVEGGLLGGSAWWRTIQQELEERPIFIVVLSPDALESQWVNDEIDIAWQQKNSPAGKLIMPVLYRDCKIHRADLRTRQIISFLEPKPYEVAFKELLVALNLPTDVETKKTANEFDDQALALVQQMSSQIEAAFSEQDWPAVIYKTDFLIKRAPLAISSTLYLMQGRALFEEGEKQLAIEALNAALALANDHTQRLGVLSEYTAILSSLGEWDEVLRKVKEALRLVPNDFDCLVLQTRALLQLGRNDEARTICEHLHSLNPNDKNVQALANAFTPFDKSVDVRVENSQRFADRMSDITSWQAGDITSLSSREKKRYYKRKLALEEYFTTEASIEEIAVRYHLLTEKILELAEKCLMQHEDGSAWGFRALVPGVAVIDHALQPASDVSGTPMIITPEQMIVFHTSRWQQEKEQLQQAQIEQKMLSARTLLAADKSDIGKQCEQNEDCVYKRIESLEEGGRGLFIIADGMGNYQAGEVASRLAVETIGKAMDSFFKPLSDQATISLSPSSNEEMIKAQPLMADSQISRVHKLPETTVLKAIEDQLKAAIQQANKAILRYGEQKAAARGLGCTVTAALIQNDQAYIANVGDSRTYLLRNGDLKPITRDHSLVARLVEAKQIEPDDVYSHPQSNLIYRSLGAGHKTVEADVFHVTLLPDDILLLCSNGLWKMVRNEQMAYILSDAPSPQIACDRLIEAANANGGEDDISAIVVEVRMR